MDAEGNKITKFLAAPKFAVAGASSNRHKYGNKVLRCYLQNNRQAVPINPNEGEVEGLITYPSLLDLPETIESVSIITPPAVTERVVEDAIKAGAKHLWMQPGAESRKAIERAESAGLSVIHGGACVLVVLGYHEF
ncbi:MAG: CoA-binding protein [Candidatus Obscuribacterales bacterium]|nr:CoA-binding protein [Candidatus Obscuribacterales bacterium]